MPTTPAPADDPTTGPPAGGGPGAAFVEHFAFLCAGEDDRGLLRGLAATVRSFEVADDGSAHAVLGWVGEPHDVRCGPPFVGRPAPGVPASYVDVARTHNGISWESYGGGPLGHPGLGADGLPDSVGVWEHDALEEGDNEEFLARLGAAGLSPADLQEAFGSGQNWILFDPLRATTGGEHAVAFVSHESCEWEPMASTEGVGYGTVLLWQLSDYFLDTELIHDTHN
ncbi:hypothetical protein [Oerskovia flava]|uniref:hypothetical protein n=1 Tax=Oerskovia flava TaxID=2986422 RepID=UPI00223F7032|nr:hypothetical protein [Oerskovia sp. JB1-3-2]